MEENKPLEENTGRDAVTAVCVLKFMECMKERGLDNATYMADPDRTHLLNALCDYAGVSPKGALAKHFLSFIDGVDTGIAIGKGTAG